ncbi:MAG: YegS/Rv2252/BmrU family lipid kinase [Porphyromonadaceae bacterium]|nr:YegS/Rv2252/BmrU family lipid kinase [Porphyromonadaceae bacterium]
MLSKNKKIAFIVNPVSGTITDKRKVTEEIQSSLDRSIYEDFRIAYTESRGHGTELAEAFLKDGFHYIVAVGGDGTVNEVGKALIHTDAALGVISTGSGNGLARHLHIPMNFKKAIEQLNFSEVVKIDYGLANDKPFFCTAGTGFDAYVSHKFADGKKRGVFGYIEQMVTGFLNYEPEHYRLVREDIDFEGKAFVITFANASQWGNNAYIAPDASVQDGLIDVSIISNLPITAIPSLAFELFTKSIHKDMLFNSLKAHEITLYRDTPGLFHLDGDPYEEGSKINIKVVPAGLNVMVKKRF